MAMGTLASNRTSTEHRGIFLLFVFILSVLRPVLFGQNLSTVQAAARLTEEYAPSLVARTALVLHAGVQAKLPSEEVALPNLQQPVEILVDRWGVPHIYAKNESDLFFAQGFYVVRERLFQMDLWRRRGLEGRANQVFKGLSIRQSPSTSDEAMGESDIGASDDGKVL
jgi:Penicillin amidase